MHKAQVLSAFMTGLFVLLLNGCSIHKPASNNATIKQQSDMQAQTNPPVVQKQKFIIYRVH